MDYFFSVFAIASTFFLVTNPIGNSPTILALVKDFDFEKQKKIVFREAIFSFIVALFFQFFGELFLGILNVSNSAVALCGGILLFIVALNMIFAIAQPEEHVAMKQEPFLVPIATPLLSGPGLLTIIMLKSREESNDLKIFLAILLAWVGVVLVLTSAPYLQKILGKRVMVALEQLMGFILSMIAMGMIAKGASLFIKTL